MLLTAKNNNQMEIETDSVPAQVASEQQNAKPSGQDRQFIEDLPSSLVASEIKASENQEPEVKQVMARHKLIKKMPRSKSKILDRMQRRGFLCQENKTSNHSQQLDSQLAQSKLPASALALGNTLTQNLGYTFFAKEIDQYYLPKPGPNHLQAVEGLLTVSDLSNDYLLNQTPAHIDSKSRARQSLQSYLSLIQDTQSKKDKIVTLFRNQKQSTLSFYSIQNQKQGKKDQILFEAEGHMTLPNQDVKMICTRDAFMKKLSDKQQQYNSIYQDKKKQLSQISKELIFLNQCLKKQSEYNMLHLQSLKHSLEEELKQQDPPQLELIEDNLCTLLFQKNISLALEFKEFDVMNYFKQKSCEEEKREFIPIENHKKMIEYIKKKRPTKIKKPKNPLYTSCTACLSGYYEQANPLTYCHDCYNRIHRNCRLFLDGEECCRLCAAKRIKSKRKDFVECVLCPAQGLTYMKVGTSNVHAFCVLITNKYRIVNQKITVNPDILEGLPTASICYVCHQSSNKLYKYSDSDFSVHPTCAFLSGYEMSFKNNTLSIEMSSLPLEQRISNGFHRKYRLNYGGLAFRCYSFDDYKRSLGIATSSSKDNKSSSHKDKQSWGSEQEMFLEDEPEPEPVVPSEEPSPESSLESNKEK